MAGRPICRRVHSGGHRHCDRGQPGHQPDPHQRDPEGSVQRKALHRLRHQPQPSERSGRQCGDRRAGAHRRSRSAHFHLSGALLLSQRQADAEKCGHHPLPLRPQRVWRGQQQCGGRPQHRHRQAADHRLQRYSGAGYVLLLLLRSDQLLRVRRRGPVDQCGQSGHQRRGPHHLLRHRTRRGFAGQSDQRPAGEEQPVHSERKSAH